MHTSNAKLITFTPENMQAIREIAERLLREEGYKPSPSKIVNEALATAWGLKK